jgi:hypothetical protein
MKAKGNEQSIENGARQKKKKKLIPAGYRIRVAGSVNHNNFLEKYVALYRADTLYMYM